MSFRVPEKYRVLTGRMGSTKDAGNNGVFVVPSKVAGRTLYIIASDGTDWQESNLPGEPWEHVSVHVERGKKSAMPTWEEMCQVKGLFWDDEDSVVQFHPPRSQYVNCHPFTLHLWRPVTATIPLPPPITVGPNIVRPDIAGTSPRISNDGRHAVIIAALAALYGR